MEQEEELIPDEYLFVVGDEIYATLDPANGDLRMYALFIRADKVPAFSNWLQKMLEEVDDG